MNFLITILYMLFAICNFAIGAGGYSGVRKLYFTSGILWLIAGIMNIF